MNTFHRHTTSLQTCLLALLPKGGAPVTVRQLAEATDVSQYQVTTALFDPYLAHEVDYDIVADAYSAPQLPGPLKVAPSPNTAGASSY